MQTLSPPLANLAYGCSFAFLSQSTEPNSASVYIRMACVYMSGIEFRRELGLRVNEKVVINITKYAR